MKSNTIAFLFGRITAIGEQLICRLRQHHKDREARRILTLLDDRLLADIGLGRGKASVRQIRDGRDP